MALFGLGKKVEKKKQEATVRSETTKKEKTKHEVSDASTKDTKEAPLSSDVDLSGILLRPHVTEKATELSERGVYAFDVRRDANKTLVAAAVAAHYKVTPRKVAIVSVRAKMTKHYRTGRAVVKKRGGKKALVYLKKGDKIEFV